ncbi:helix-turn-helix domain-containing protein [Streptomyces sp. NPDC004647]|uniref:helix-turn-helix domain-containing protein n=1 Tax=Streptomyces sp. NPDC004647 TaxID=3154671 RepID=UPI0033A7E9CA
MDQHIGARVRVARTAAGLTQSEMAGFLSKSVRWVEDVEAGRHTLDRYSVITAVAEVCDVDVVWLLGQPYRLRGEGGSVAHSYIPAVRAVLRRSSLILSGHPGLAPQGLPASAEVMRSRSLAANRARQAANLPEVASLLATMLDDLNSAVLIWEGADREAALRLMVDGARTTRMALNQLGYPDLAWVAAEVAAGAARQLDDPMAKAAVAWDRCGALLHQASPRDAVVVAEAALRDLEPLTVGSAPDRSAIALHGALVLRCAVASARARQEADSWAQITRALEDAGRLGPDFHDVAGQTVFGRANCAVHAAEVGVELDRPDVGLKFVPNPKVEEIPSKERRTHFMIDRARSYKLLGRAPAAVNTLRQAANYAPYYVYADPMARALVADLTRTGVRGQESVLSTLVRNMELAR